MMTNTKQKDIKFLNAILEKTILIKHEIELLDPGDFLGPDHWSPKTSAKSEKCARLVDRHGFDGSIFRVNNYSYDEDDIYDLYGDIKNCTQIIKMIPRIIDKIEAGGTAEDDQKSNQHSERPSENDQSHSIDSSLMERMSLAMLDDTSGAEIIQIAANAKHSANDKMCLIIQVDKRYESPAFNSSKWATLLGVTAGAIRQLEKWKSLHGKTEE